MDMKSVFYFAFFNQNWNDNAKGSDVANITSSIGGRVLTPNRFSCGPKRCLFPTHFERGFFFVWGQIDFNKDLNPKKFLKFPSVMRAFGKKNLE